MIADQAKALAPTQRGSLTSSSKRSVRAALEERITLSEAVRIVGSMVACFPNGGQGSGRGYMGALASILVTYPAQIAKLSADPIRGVPRETKFLPTPCDVITWCERELTALRKPVDLADRNAELADKMQSDRMSEEDWQKARLARKSYDELVAKYGPNWGIRDSMKPVAKRSAYKSLTDDELRALYGPRHDESNV